MKVIYTYILGMALLFACSGRMQAQSIFSLSESFRSARSLGMGAVSGTMDANAFSVYDNASKVAFSERKMDVGLQYSPWMRNMNEGLDRNNLMLNFGGYWSLGQRDKIMAGITYYAPGGDDMYEMDEEGNVVGDRINPGYVSASVGYARVIGQYWGVAATLNYAHWNPGAGDKVSAVSLDLSASRRWKMNDADFVDLSFKAAGWGGAFTDADGFNLPGILSVGALYNKDILGAHIFRAALELGARCMDQAAFNGSAGIEYIFNNVLFVRGGYHFTSYENRDNGFVSLGLGLRFMDRLEANCSYLLASYESPLKNTFMVGLNVMF